jgi:hypothetical protein
MMIIVIHEKFIFRTNNTFLTTQLLDTDERRRYAYTTFPGVGKLRKNLII